MEFTRPMDRDFDSVRKEDKQKEVNYSRLRQTLERTLQPGWKVQIATFSGARRLLTRSGDDGHAKAGAKTGGDLVIVRTQ